MEVKDFSSNQSQIQGENPNRFSLVEMQRQKEPSVFDDLVQIAGNIINARNPGDRELLLLFKFVDSYFLSRMRIQQGLRGAVEGRLDWTQDEIDFIGLKTPQEKKKMIIRKLAQIADLKREEDRHTFRDVFRDMVKVLVMSPQAR